LIVSSNHSILMHLKAILTSLKHQSMDNYIRMDLIWKECTIFSWQTIQNKSILGNKQHDPFCTTNCLVQNIIHHFNFP
jgi:hypothetical protein